MVGVNVPNETDLFFVLLLLIETVTAPAPAAETVMMSFPAVPPMNSAVPPATSGSDSSKAATT